MEPYVRAVEDFGKRLGIAELVPGEEGRVELAFGEDGLLQMEPADEGVLVTMARPWPPHAEHAAARALKLCHWRENRPWPINAGAKGGEWLTFTAFLSMGEFDVPTLEAVLECLTSLHEAVVKAG